MKLYQYRQMYIYTFFHNDHRHPWPPHINKNSQIVGWVNFGGGMNYMLSQIPRIFRIPTSLRSHLRSWKSAKGFLPSCGRGPTSPTTRMTTMRRWGTSGMGMNGVEGDAARRMEDTQQIQLSTQYPVSTKKGFGCGHFHFHTPRKNARDMFFGWSFVVISSHFFRMWDQPSWGTWMGHALTPLPCWRGRCYELGEIRVVW